MSKPDPNPIWILACIVASVTGMLWMGSTAGAERGGQDKVTICHFTGREGTDRHVTLTLPVKAVFGKAGHFNENGTTRAGHEHDRLGPCEPPTTTTEAPSSTTTTTSSPATSSSAPTTTAPVTTVVTTTSTSPVATSTPSSTTQPEPTSSTSSPTTSVTPSSTTPSTLAFGGSENTAIAGFGGLLIGLGLLASRLARR